MSDETPPAPLRLRPRTRPESETPAEAAAEVAEGKLRLKPKLIAEPEPEPEAVIEPEPVVSEPEPVAEEAVPELPPDPEPPVDEEVPPPPMPDEGKVKLKIKLANNAAVQETAEPEQAAEPAGEEEPSLPPFPVVAPPPPEAGEEEAEPVVPKVSTSPFLKTAVGVPPGGRPAVFKRPRVPAALLAAERRKRMWKYALIAVGGLVLAFIVIGTAIKLNPPAPAVIPPPPRPKFEAPPEPVAVTPAHKAVPTPDLPTEPVSNERVASTATIELAPGITATTESIKAVPNATPAFRTFVASAKISGVYQGDPPRAFINGRLVRMGEMVDELMEIHFDSVDSATRSIVFKDSSGATVSRRY